MPRQRGFRSIRVYYTVRWRLAPASCRQHPTDTILISQRCFAFPEGMRRQRLSLYAGFSHRAANTRLRQATKAAHRTDCDFPETAMLSQRFSAWHEPHFATAFSARPFLSLCCGRVVQPRLSWCLLCFAFPGSKFSSEVHLPKPN